MKVRVPFSAARTPPDTGASNIAGAFQPSAKTTVNLLKDRNIIWLYSLTKSGKTIIISHDARNPCFYAKMLTA